MKPRTNEDANSNWKIFITGKINELYNSKDNLLIGIGGPGGTGKTMFARKLMNLLENCKMISLDDYRLPRSERELSGLKGSDPSANKINLIKDHFSLIRKNESFTKPVYNPLDGTDINSENYKPVKINLIEGELVFSDNLVNCFDLLLYLDSEPETQLKSRLNRDKQKNLSQEEIITLFRKSNIEDYEKFYSKNKLKTDVLLFSGTNYDIRVID